MRDPVTRAISHYLSLKMITNNHWSKQMAQNENITDEDMLANLVYLPDKRRRTSHQEWPIDADSFQLKSDILNHGFYFEHLKQWLRYFPREQFLFVNGERFRHEPNVEIDKVQTFLNLDFIIQKSHFVLNEKRGAYCI